MADILIEERYKLDFDATAATESIIDLAANVASLTAATDKAKASGQSYIKQLKEQKDAEKQLNAALNQEVTTYDAIVAKRKISQLALSTLTKGTREYAVVSKQVNDLEKRELNTLDGLNAKINELRLKRGQLEIGTTAYKNTLKELTVLEAKAAKETGSLAKSSGSFVSALRGGVAALGVGLGASEIIGATRNFEKLFATLKQATGSQGTATRVFAEIQQFAKETPFQLNEVVGAFVKLENRNFKPTIAQLRALGDIASSQGKSLDQFVEAVLDAQTGEFERLKEFGIVARKNGENVTLSFRGQATTIKNTSDNITKYLLELSKLPGIQGSAVAVAKTLDGSLSNLQDNFTQLAATIGGGGGVLKAIVDQVNNLVGAFNDLLAVPLSENLEKERESFNGVSISILNAAVGTDERTAAVQRLIAEHPQFLKGIDAEKATNEQLKPILDQINKSYIIRIALQKQQEKILPILQREAETALDLAEKRAAYNVQLAKGAELVGINISNIQGEAAQIKAVTEALQEKVKAQGANLSFSASEEAIVLNRLKGQYAINQAIALQGVTSKRSADAEAERLAVTEELKKTYGELFDVAKSLDEERVASSPKDSPTAKQVDFISGSLADLEANLSKLRERITKNVGATDVKALTPLLQQIAQLETRIKAAKKLQDELLTGKPIANFAELQTKDVQAAQIALEAKRAEIQEQSIRETNAIRLRAIEEEQRAAIDGVTLTTKERVDIEAKFQLSREQLALETDRKIAVNAIQQKQLELLELQRTSGPGQNEEKIAKLKADLADLQARLAALQNKEVDIKIKADPKAKKKLDDDIRQITESAISLANQVADALGAIFDRQAQRADAAVEKQKSALSDALANSEDFSAKQIEIERERLDQFQKEQEQAAAKAKALQVAQVIAQTIIAVAKAAGQTGVAAPVAILGVLAAIAGGIAAAGALAGNSFYEGTDYVPLGNNKRGRDTIPARLHEGEAVIQAGANRDYHKTVKAIRRHDIPADVLNGFVDSYRSGSQMNFQKFHRKQLPQSVTTTGVGGGSQNIYFQAKLNRLETEAAATNRTLERIERNTRGGTAKQLRSTRTSRPDRFV